MIHFKIIIALSIHNTFLSLELTIMEKYDRSTRQTEKKKLPEKIGREANFWEIEISSVFICDHMSHVCYEYYAINERTIGKT